VTVTGIAKGAGMMAPNMATMLAFVATDAPIAAALLRELAAPIADASFNRVTIDGDTSTNDSFVLIASGAAAMRPIERLDDPRLASVRAALLEVATELSQAIVRDGEGATKFIAITVEGGRDIAECDDVSPSGSTKFWLSRTAVARARIGRRMGSASWRSPKSRSAFRSAAAMRGRRCGRAISRMST